jgi:hypothetical protein
VTTVERKKEVCVNKFMFIKLRIIYKREFRENTLWWSERMPGTKPSSWGKVIPLSKWKYLQQWRQIMMTFYNIEELPLKCKIFTNPLENPLKRSTCCNTVLFSYSTVTNQGAIIHYGDMLQGICYKQYLRYCTLGMIHFLWITIWSRLSP